MAEKSMDSQVVHKTILAIMEPLLSKMPGITATQEPQANECDIIEYENRMRVGGMEKFNAPSFVSVVNYYLNPTDMERHRAKGALVIYVDFENASKIFKALGFTIPEDEDDLSLMDACGQLSHLIAGNLKDEFLRLGYVDLTISPPQNYKNSVIEGVEFSPNQKKKCECSFFYWRRKSIVVEVTMASIPQKR